MTRTAKPESSDEQKHLTALEAAGYRDFNKTLLILSAGAFALSFLILEKMSSPNYMLFIVYTWLFWIISILINLGALSIYPKAIREAAQLADDKAHSYYTKMRGMGLISTAGFGMGIFFFVVFVLYNLNCF